MQMTPRLRADLMLFLTAIIWGSAFVAQRIGAVDLGVYLFNATRFFGGAVILIGIVTLSSGSVYSGISAIFTGWGKKFMLTALLAGGVLFIASGLQQAGLQYTTAGNAGFITGLYVVIVPFLVRFTGRGVGWMSWFAAGLAVFGLGLLSVGDSLFSEQGFTINRGDLLELGGAFFWALHVLIVGYAMQHEPARSMHKAPLIFSAIQFLAAGSVHLIAGVAFEVAVLSWSARSIWAVAYVAVLSTALGYTLQVAGQRHAPEVDAALILSLEAVFAALFGYLILAEQLQPVQLAGCAIILGAILLSQIRSDAN